jgi:Protein of unknown function (DUF2630)
VRRQLSRARLTGRVSGYVRSVEDAALLKQIGRLIEKERSLERGISGAGPDDDVSKRLLELETTLDQLWDELRQRRARRDVGGDPDQAHRRNVETVETYEQ